MRKTFALRLTLDAQVFTIPFAAVTSSRFYIQRKRQAAAAASSSSEPLVTKRVKGSPQALNPAPEVAQALAVAQQALEEAYKRFRAALTQAAAAGVSAESTPARQPQAAESVAQPQPQAAE